MNGYLLDRDVLGALENPAGNRNVHRWASGVADDRLFLSALTVVEASKGLVRLRLKARAPEDTTRLDAYQRSFDAIFGAFAGRILPVGGTVALKWGSLLALWDANVLDAGVAATAAVHGLVVATRNLCHFRNRGVALLDPFANDPAQEPQPS